MMLLVAISTIAIPAKPGVWRTISLTDGTQVKVQLVGDEFMHYYQSADGTRYQYDESTGNYYLQSETSYADARHRALCPWRSAKNRHPMIYSAIFLRDK